MHLLILFAVFATIWIAIKIRNGEYLRVAKAISGYVAYVSGLLAIVTWLMIPGPKDPRSRLGAMDMMNDILTFAIVLFIASLAIRIIAGYVGSRSSKRKR